MTITTEKRGLMHYAEYWKSEKSENQKNVREERTMKVKEWLDTLSGIERDKEVIKKMHKWTSTPFFVDYEKLYREWIESEHKTTGHEDLVNAGWWVEQYYVEPPIKYHKEVDGTQFVLEIYEHENKYKASDINGYYYDDGIDFLRKCADKIRKEKGWA